MPIGSIATCPQRSVFSFWTISGLGRQLAKLVFRKRTRRRRLVQIGNSLSGQRWVVRRTGLRACRGLISLQLDLDIAPKGNQLGAVIDLDDARVRIGRHRMLLDPVEEDMDFLIIRREVEIVLKSSVSAICGDPSMKCGLAPDATAIKEIWHNAPT